MHEETVTKKTWAEQKLTSRTSQKPNASKISQKPSADNRARKAVKAAKFRLHARCWRRQAAASKRGNGHALTLFGALALLQSGLTDIGQTHRPNVAW